MLDSFLSTKISNALNKIPYNSLCELRIRANNPTIVNILGENYFLCNTQLSKISNESLTVSMGELQSIIQKISKKLI